MRYFHLVLCIGVLLCVQGTMAVTLPEGTWESAWLVSLDRPTAVPDYQVKVVLLPSQFDYLTAQAGGGDIRFTGTGNRFLSYWTESWDPKTGSVLWVKVPDAGTTGFYMLSGNPSAQNAGNGADTFVLFDDFSRTSLDAGLWEERGTGTLAFNGSVLLSTGEKALFSKKTIPDIYNKVLEVRGQFHGSTENDVDIGFGTNTGTSLWSGEAQGQWIVAHGWDGAALSLKNTGDVHHCYEEVSSNRALWDPKAVHTYSLVFTPETVTVLKDYAPYISMYSDDCSLHADSLPVEIVLDHYNRLPNNPQLIDWVRVRASVPVEPKATISRIAEGTAETGPGALPVLVLAFAGAVVLIVAILIIRSRNSGTSDGSIVQPAVSLTHEVALGQSPIVELEIENPGSETMAGIRVQIIPPADIRLDQTTYSLPGLRPGENRIIRIPFQPVARGIYAIGIGVSFEIRGKAYHTEFPAKIRVK